MNIEAFLAKVLPAQGVYISAIIGKGGGVSHGFYPSVKKLAESCVKLDAAGYNVFYALGAYNNNKGRRKDNVRAMKAVIFDIDCGPNKPYADYQAGGAALGKFLHDLSLPEPTLVFSGMGLHVYWVLEEEVSEPKWQELALRMKQASVDHGLHADRGLTGNSAVILRPIDTTNPKHSTKVRLIVDAKPVAYDDLIALLPQVATQQISSTPQPAPNTLLANLAATQDYTPSNAAAIVANCKQVEELSTNQSTVSEPLWYNLLGIAAYCEDAEGVAKRWSKLHPDYDEVLTINKMDQWKKSATGPTTCSRFMSDRPDGCKGCKFKGKITSPAQLGVQHVAVGVSVDAPDAVATSIGIPKGFKRVDPYKTGVVQIKLMVDSVELDVCPFDIYPVGYGPDESLGYETYRYKWKRPHLGWQPLTLRQAHMADGSREFAAVINDQGIGIYAQKQLELFRAMLRSYMERLKREKALVSLCATMGWKDNFTTFVLGNTIFKRGAGGVVTEETIDLAKGIQKQGSELYNKQGSLDTWTTLTSLLEQGGLLPHMFALGVGFSAPLYNFTGLKGITVSLYGPSGSGKSLAQQWVQSIYGDPDKLHFAAKYTQNSLFSRLGLYAHLPMTVDEATLMADKDVGEFCYWVTQGKDKARLGRDSQEREAKTWATPVIVSTNTSLQSKLIASGLETEAQAARLLELNVGSQDAFAKNSEVGKLVYDTVHANYGHAGRIFLTKLMEMGEAGIRAMIADATATFADRYNSNFIGSERYWEQAIVLSDLSMRLAKEWGLIKFEPEKATAWVLEEIEIMRKGIADNKIDSFDLMAEYMSEFAETILTILKSSNPSQPAVQDTAFAPRNDIRIRLELHGASINGPYDKGLLVFDRVHFRQWVSARGSDYRTFKRDMKEAKILVKFPADRASLGKNAPTKKTLQTYVVGFTLDHDRLRGLLNDRDVLLKSIPSNPNVNIGTGKP